ncbi:unnamed protein product [Closterium sp. NIES-53]
MPGEPRCLRRLPSRLSLTAHLSPHRTPTSSCTSASDLGPSALRLHVLLQPQATPLSTRHSLSALPSEESVEPSGPYPELVGCLMYLMTCTRPDLAYPLSILARYVAPGRHVRDPCPVSRDA